MATTWDVRLGRRCILMISIVGFEIALRLMGVPWFIHDDEHLMWDLVLGIFYLLHTALIAIAIRFYIYGYQFKVVLPTSSSREDQLMCVKANFRSWAEEFVLPYSEYERQIEDGLDEDLEQYCVILQKELAFYLADTSLSDEPSNNTEYLKRDNISSCALRLMVMIALARCHIFLVAGIYCGVYWPEDSIANFYVHWIFTTLMFSWYVWVFGFGSRKRWKYTLIVDPGNLGRAMGMRSFVQNIRKDYLSNEIEKGEGDIKESIFWWIENLLKVDKVGLYGKLPLINLSSRIVSEEEYIIKDLKERIQASSNSSRRV